VARLVAERQSDGQITAALVVSAPPRRLRVQHIADKPGYSSRGADNCLVTHRV
jgi:hypothetical protein